MLLRASLFLVVALATVGCGPKKGGKLSVDTPVLPYKAPDIEELSGVEEEPDPPPMDEQPKAEAPPAAPVTSSVAATPATTAQPAATKPAATKPPAAPAKAPAKPPAAPATPAKKP